MAEVACTYCARVMPDAELCEKERRCKECCECNVDWQDHQGDWR